MDISSPLPRQQSRRLAALAIVASAVLLVCPAHALASSASGSPGTVKLDRGSVSPTTGTTSTVFTFRVTYTNRADLAPSTISVVIDRTAHTMVRDSSDTNYRDGALFTYSTKLSARWHTYYFSGSDIKGRRNILLGGVILVRSTSTTGGTTTSTTTHSSGSGSGSSGSGSTGSGTTSSGGSASRPPTSASSGSGSGSGSPSGGTGTGTGATWSAGSTSASGQGSVAAGAVGALVGSGVVAVIGDGVWPDAAPTGAVFAGQSAVNFAPARPAVQAAAGTVRRTGGFEFGDAPLPMYGSDEWERAMAQTLVLSTSTSVTFAMAMLFFARRRRIEEDARARENEMGPAPLVDEMTLASYLYGPQRAAAMAAELTLPRWRRPSLTAARTREGPGQAVIAAERLRFDRGELAFGEGREFRRIRYRMVRLSDRPDEILGYELGRLDEGDEIEVLERTGFYVRIRTPYGLEGWVHRTTVGTAVTADADRRSDASADGNGQYVSPQDSLVGRLIRERSAV